MFVFNDKIKVYSGFVKVYQTFVKIFLTSVLQNEAHFVVCYGLCVIYALEFYQV